MQKRLIILFAVMAIILLASFAEAGATKKKQEVRPQLFVTTPGNSQVVVGNYMTVQVFSPTTKISRTSGKNRAGEGYLLLSTDKNPAVKSYTTTYRMSIAQLSEGRHTLNVELVQNDGSSFTPVVKKSIEFSIIRSQLVRLNELQKQQRRYNPQRFHPARLFSTKRI